VAPQAASAAGEGPAAAAPGRGADAASAAAAARFAPPGAAPAAGPGAGMAWEHYDFSDDPRTARAGHSATAVGKYVYVLGGRRG
jgi:hypothetical protein